MLCILCRALGYQVCFMVDVLFIRSFALLSAVHMCRQAGRTGQRSRSAPREAAAMSQHVKRMQPSPARPATTGGVGGAAASSSPGQQQSSSGRPKSNPRYSKGYIERLYEQGVEKVRSQLLMKPSIYLQSSLLQAGSHRITVKPPFTCCCNHV
jgi:hypothetical protein